MTNNDKLQQIISDIRILSDLTNSMMGAENYPVSFFSQVFDLMQTIQNNFHELEADQVERFASEIKKHQALIISIHKQMRHIDVPSAEPPANPSVSPKAVQQTLVTEPAPLKKEKTNRQREDKQKKVSFLSRLGISREPETPKKTVQKTPSPDVKPATDSPLIVNTEQPSGGTSPQAISKTPSPIGNQTDDSPQKPAPKIIEALTLTPTIKPSTKKKPSEAATSPESVSKTTAKSTITIPESSARRITRLPRPGARTISGKSKTPEEPETVKASNRIPAEGSAPPSINDAAMEKQKLSDLRKAFSLNDRFLYRRELFGGNEEVMNKVITTLNNKTSYRESILFLEEKLHWNFTDPTVKDFIKIVELRFL
jgi:hypothetical protein